MDPNQDTQASQPADKSKPVVGDQPVGDVPSSVPTDQPEPTPTGTPPVTTPPTSGPGEEKNDEGGGVPGAGGTTPPTV